MNTEVSHYQIIKTISESSEHLVSLAVNKLSGQQVVLKKVNSFDNTSRAGIVFRLKREAEILQEFCSDFVVKLLDVLENERSIYLIMEYCQGKNLRQACLEMPLEGKIQAFLSAAEALESIHQKDVVHRDLKPDNILVLNQPEMRLKIIDFGLAYIKNLTDVFREGTVVGTLAYLSPEQTGLLRRPLDNRTDLYSLGATFYEVFSGRLPFTEKDPLKLIHAHLSTRPQTPSLLNKEIPPMLDQILLKLLEKEPSERYQQALGLKNDLLRLLENPQQTFEVAFADKENRVEYHIKAVGRDEEIKTLRELHAESLRGQFKAQFILGKSGIGKSKIMEAFKESLDYGSTFLFQSQCSPDTKNVPFRIFREFFSYFFNQPAGQELISFLIEKFQKDLVFFQALLPDSFMARVENAPVYSEKPLEKQQFFAAIGRFILELGSIKKSFVWCVEDFQWADLASMELISYLSKNLVGLPFYLLCTNRLEEQDEPFFQQNPQFHILDLKELSYSSLPLLVASILGQQGDWGKEFYLKIYQDSLGNTFYMIEIIKALIKEKILVREKGSWVLKNKLFLQYEFKTDMTQLIFARLSDFSNEEKDILTSASILGKEFNLDMLQRVLKKERKTFAFSKLFSLMEKAKKQQILEENYFKSANSYAFMHDKIVEALQKKLSQAELYAKHELCAIVLEQSDGERDIYQLAYHYNFTSNRAQKIHYNELAAGKALAQYSLVETVYYMEKVSKEYFPITPASKKAEIQFMLKTAGLMQQAGFLDKSRDLVVELMENLGEQKLASIKVEALTLLGSFHYFKNELPLALKYYQEAIEEGEKTGQKIQYWRPYFLVGNTYFYKSEYNLSIPYFSKALELIPANEKDNYAMVLGLRLYSYYFLGKITDGEPDKEELEKNMVFIENPIILSHIYHSLALCYNWKGQHAKGLEYSLMASALGEKAGYAIAIYAALFSRILSYFFMEDYEKLSETFQQVTQLAQKNKMSLIIEVFRCMEAFGLLLAKKYQELESMLDEFLPGASHMDNKFAHVVFLYLRSALHYVQNRPEDSLRYITEALKLSRERELDITSPWLLIFYYELLKVKEHHVSLLEIEEQINGLLEKKPGLSYMFEHARKITLFLNSQRLEHISIHQTLSSTSVFKEKLQLENIVKTSQMISSILDTEILLDSILQSMLETTGAQRGVLKLNQQQKHPESFILKNLTDAEPDFNFILKLLSKSHKQKTGQILSQNELDDKEILSAIYNPLIIKGNVIGMVYLDSKVIKDLFSEEDLKLLNIFTAQAAIAIENARTFEDLKQERNSLEVKVKERTRELSNKNRIIEQRNRQFMDELKLAQIIQEGLIPSKPPEIPGIRLASLYKPMEDVGGDFFDFVKVREPHLLGIFISDVSGHGVPAALITSMVKTLVETAGEKRVRPQELLGYMNDKLTGQTGGNFLTAFYGVYDTQTRVLTYARGAHNAPFLMRGSEIFTLESRGKMLGLLENLDFEEKEMVLHPGDKLLFYTDGLTEAANAQGLEFEEIMPKILQELKTLPAGEFLDQLYHALLNHREDFLFEDDVCVVVMDVD